MTYGPEDDFDASARPQPRWRVLIAEDHEIVGQALAALLMSHGFQVVGEARDGRSAVALCQSLLPDVVVMDMSMPDLPGHEATRIVRRDCPRTAVVALSGHSALEWVEAALEAGAGGYVLKDVAYEDLPLAIEAVLAGERYISARIDGGRALLERIAHRVD